MTKTRNIEDHRFANTGNKHDQHQDTEELARVRGMAMEIGRDGNGVWLASSHTPFDWKFYADVGNDEKHGD